MGKSIDVDLDNFVITMKKDGVFDWSIEDCSFGRKEGENNLTPLIHNGRLSKSKRKERYWSIENQAWMPFSLFFHGTHEGCAFHWGNTFTESHGCVHLCQADAERLYKWAGGPPFSEPETVALEVHGTHPDPGARVYDATALHLAPDVILRINTILHEKNHLARSPDTIFNAETAEAVRHFQIAAGFTGDKVDGRVGFGTATAMGIASSPDWPSPPAGYDNDVEDD